MSSPKAPIFSSSPSIFDEGVLDSVTLRAVKATNMKGYVDNNGKHFFGYEMGDGSYLVVTHASDIRSPATDTGWQAARLDGNGEGIRCTRAWPLHDAMLHAMKLPAPYFHHDGEIKVLEVVAEDDTDARKLMSEMIEASLAPNTAKFG